MKQIVTCKEMKALDGNMIEGIGIPSCVLMERAALKVAEELERTLADKKQEERILCVCGSGNNGGDGVAVARILKLHGYRTSLYLVGNPDHRTVEMQRQLDIAAACQVPVVNNLETEYYSRCHFRRWAESSGRGQLQRCDHGTESVECLESGC